MRDIIHFSTAGLQTQDKMGAWRQCLDQTFCSLDVSCDPEEELSARIDRRQVGSLGISRACLSRMEVRRTSRSIAQDPVERFCFVFPLAGKTMHRQRGIEAVAGRGEMYFLNTCEPHDILHSAATEVICLTMPCALLRLYIPHIDDKRLQVGGATALIAPTLMQLLGGTLSHDVGAPNQKMEAVCAEMLDLMLTLGA